jgi:hypothetical protein
MTHTGPGAQSPAQLARKNHRLDRRRRQADQALAEMKAGAALLLQFQNGRSLWRLTSGRFVPADVATLITNRPDIVDCGDSLFLNGPAQTWRYCNPKESDHD